ncbi:hypothetical protein BX661DRAFT_168242 [Kickxella alabastrina]|uniref:uncharacterized protein n=1 Tax=Kickxella alabastrina TaxID=61397 RepID=UPI00221F5338|nr:uncharacterized protein BX661DRAFT_168242 [Kickxella alabastrina]KAI7835072.1 hypothetical protein BX661DRAFT_168242 [Kickxella alabastrina]
MGDGNGDVAMLILDCRRPMLLLELGVADAGNSGSVLVIFDAILWREYGSRDNSDGGGKKLEPIGCCCGEDAVLVKPLWPVPNTDVTAKADTGVDTEAEAEADTEADAESGADGYIIGLLGSAAPPNAPATCCDASVGSSWNDDAVDENEHTDIDRLNWYDASDSSSVPAMESIMEDVDVYDAATDDTSDGCVAAAEKAHPEARVVRLMYTAAAAAAIHATGATSTATTAAGYAFTAGVLLKFQYNSRK